MRRLTIHLNNVDRVNHNGKSKTFNTLAFVLTTGTDKEINSILRNHQGNVKKSYISNIR